MLLVISTTQMKSCCTFRSPAEKVGDNHDLLTEILLRLPAKSLLKFKCVSKWWLSLISDSKFCSSHARRHRILNPTPAALLLNHHYSSAPQFHAVFLKNDAVLAEVPFLDYLSVPRVKILQSCNGLLLCSSSFLLKVEEKSSKHATNLMGLMDYFDYSCSVVTDDDRGFRFFVCNPTTKQFKLLSHPTRKFNHFMFFLSLAFDPLKSPYYKVIYVQFVGEFKDRYQIDIYSSETDSWTLLPNCFQVQYGIHGDGVFCNGAVHWYSHEPTSLYFDLDSETLKTMPMPCVFRRKSRTRDVLYFGECRGRLVMVVTNDWSALEFDIFEMGFDYSGWVVKYHVDLLSLRSVFSGLFSNWEVRCSAFSVLSFVLDEFEEAAVVVLLVDGIALSYNVCNGRSHTLCDLKLRAGTSGTAVDYEGHDAYQYFESLICVSA